MKPPPFDYHRASNLADALAALAQHGDRAKLLAGGQSLIPMLNLRVIYPERLIDIGRLDELRYVKRAGNELRIGALCTHNTVMESKEVQSACPLLTAVCHHVAHHAVRNRGTIGGSLCHNDPAAELPLAVSLLDATLLVRNTKGERTIAATEFFKDNFSTALGIDELLVEIRIPIPPPGRGWSFEEVSQRKGDFALVAAGALLSLENERCGDVRVGYRNVGSDTVRLGSVEALLEGEKLDAALVTRAAELAMRSVNPPTDLHADADYRRDLIKTLTIRVLSQALDRASQSQ